MGKRIEDLEGKLKDGELGSTIDERGSTWFRFAQSIDELLATGDYDWAFDTLDGIRDTVLQSKQVSDGQQRAVDNIERSKRGRGGSRRYEGYR